MDWLANKVVIAVLVAALGIMTGTSVYNATTARQALNAQKEMLDAIKSSGMRNNVPQKGQADRAAGGNQANVLKEIEQHVANIDAILEKREKADKQDANRFGHFFHSGQPNAGTTGKGYGPNEIH